MQTKGEPTSTEQQRVEEIAGKLTGSRAHDLTACWDAFCDADPLPHGRDYDAYLKDMERDGLISWRAVDEYDLDDAFAEERGISPGGSIIELTPLGLAVRTHLQEQAS